MLPLPIRSINTIMLPRLCKGTRKCIVPEIVMDSGNQNEMDAVNLSRTNGRLETGHNPGLVETEV